MLLLLLLLPLTILPHVTYSHGFASTYAQHCLLLTGST
jgi:hypothetical protein